MVDTQNPDLLPTGVDPQSAAALRVPVLTTLTPPDPIVDTGNVHHYICTMPNASMHRKDGTRIGFSFGHFMTQMKADIEYLESEIALGHPNLRRATKEEIHSALMRKDPRGTIRKEVEGDIRKELEAKIRKEMAEAAGIKFEEQPNEPIDPNEPANPAPGSTDEKLVSGANKLADLRERIRSGSGTVLMGPQIAPIKPVSTVDIADLAAGSAGMGGNNG